MKRSETVLLLLSGCVVVCHLQPDQFIRQFHHISQSKTWAEAQLYCREKYNDLATILSNDENKEAQQVAGSQKFWIGLFGIWKWSHTGPVPSTWFTNWGMGEPGFRKCVTISGFGFWSTRDCTEEQHFICYSGDADRYILVKELRSYYNAQSYCREKYTDLSTINSVVNNTEITALLAPSTSHKFPMGQSMLNFPSPPLAWIGLRNSWEWSDGSNVQYLPQGLQSTNGDCGVMDQSSSSWLFQSCNDKYPFLCYKDVKPSVESSVKVQLKARPTDLNDPTVQESILQQVREKLGKQGITEEVKLRWKTQPDGKVFHREEEGAPPGYCEKKDCGVV